MTFHNAPKDRGAALRQSAGMRATGLHVAQQLEGDMNDGPLWDHSDVRARQSFGVGGGFITAVLVAMQESREQQAAREIRRHQHLARKAEACVSRRSAEHLGAGAIARAGSAARARGETILIVAALIAFGALHVVGNSMFHTASSATSMSHHTLAAD